MISIYIHQTKKPLFFSIDFKYCIFRDCEPFKLFNQGLESYPTFMLCPCSYIIRNILVKHIVVSTHEVFVHCIIELLIFCCRPQIIFAWSFDKNFTFIFHRIKPALTLSPIFGFNNFCNFVIICTNFLKSIKQFFVF